MATYEIVLKNDTGGGGGESPVSGVKTTPQSGAVASNWQKAGDRLAKFGVGLVSYTALKGAASTIINHRVSTVEMRTGSNELQRRWEIASSIGGSILSIGESAAAGFMFAGVPGAGVGALIGVAKEVISKTTSYIQRADTLQLQATQENITQQMNYNRTGGRNV